MEIDSRKLPGKVSAGGTGDANPADYDLVSLAMQEPQYRSPDVCELLSAVAKSRVPCMSIMSMPPLPYLRRIPGLDANALKAASTDASVWDDFVYDVCLRLGAHPDDLVLFEKCAAAAQSLTRPASAARALQNGATNIERADKLVQLVARQLGLRHPVIDRGVDLVDTRLHANREKAAKQ